MSSQEVKKMAMSRRWPHNMNAGGHAGGQLGVRLAMLQYFGHHEARARRPRVHYPGALYHVILRGNAGQIIFDDDEDRTQFYLLAQEGIERFGHPIHALCLMTTHVHLAIQVGVGVLGTLCLGLP